MIFILVHKMIIKDKGKICSPFLCKYLVKNLFLAGPSNGGKTGKPAAVAAAAEGKQFLRSAAAFLTNCSSLDRLEDGFDKLSENLSNRLNELFEW